MVSYLQFKDLTASPVLIRLRTGYPAISLHTCSIPNPSLSLPVSLPSFRRIQRTPVPFPESMLFLCNPGTRVRTTRTRPCLVSLQAHRTGYAADNTTVSTRPPPLSRSAGCLLGAPPYGPATPSATALIHRSIGPQRGRRGDTVH